MPILSFSSSHLPVPPNSGLAFLVLTFCSDEHGTTNPPIAQLFTNPFATCAHTSPSNKLSRALLPTTTTPPPRTLHPSFPSLIIFIIHSFIWGTGTQIQTLSFSFSSRSLVQLVVFWPILGSQLRDHLPFSSKMKHPTSTGGTVRPFSSNQTSDRQAPFSMGECSKSNTESPNQECSCETAILEEPIDC